MRLYLDGWHLRAWARFDPGLCMWRTRIQAWHPNSGAAIVRRSVRAPHGATHITLN